MTDAHDPWKTLGSRIVHQSRWLTLHEDDVIKPNGEQGTYSYTTSPPFVLVVGYDGEQFVLVRQYRYPLKRMMIEFPGGSIDDGEKPLQAAKREFAEETGLTAATWTELGAIHNPNLATVFLAENLEYNGHASPDEDGIEGTIRLSWADIDQRIATGEFTDSKTLAALMLFSRHHA